MIDVAPESGAGFPLVIQESARLTPRHPGSRLRLSGTAQNAACVLYDPGSRFAWPG
ncbi:MAG: hypothetical protein WAN43_05980 [Rhodomicrobium sp.]